MFQDLLIECPMCDEQHDLQQLVLHLKRDHNLAITHLLDFQDPRYYIKLLQYINQKQPNHILENSTPRKSDNVNTLNKTDFDMELRKHAFAFQRKRALEQYNFETQNKVKYHQCFLCNQEFKNISKTQLLSHYTENHQLRIGNKLSLIYYIKMLNQIQQTTENKLCLYCHQEFQSIIKLKQHYRTHNHFRFDEKDKQFDCFYLDNYCQYKIQWGNKKQVEDLSEKSNDDQQDDLFQDIPDNELDQIPVEFIEVLNQVKYVENILQNNEYQIKCLFCNLMIVETDIQHHMKNSHQFDFSTQLFGDYYQRVKQINFIRYKISQCICPFCNVYCDDFNDHNKIHMSQQIEEIFDEIYLKPIIDGDLIFELIEQSIDENEEEGKVVE